jgi:serine protein kinase
MRDPTSGELRDPDQHFMTEIEKVLISPGEKFEDFRKSVIGTIGARALENPDAPRDYGELFKHYVHRLREDFYAKRRGVLKKINENFLKHTSEDDKQLDQKEREQADQMLATLQQKYGYCPHCARDTVAYLLKTRYAE